MNGCGKSGRPIVPGRPRNKGGSACAPPLAEGMEGRGLAERNPRGQTRTRAQIRQDLQNALDRIRQVAARDSNVELRTLWHHIYHVDRLREAYLDLKRN